jgi:hypothetical protein
VNRETVGALVLALVAVVALGTVSATLTDVVEPDPSTGGGDDGSATSPGTVPDADPGVETGEGGLDAGRESPVPSGPRGGTTLPCYSVGEHPPVLAAVLLGGVGLFAGVKRRYDTVAAVGVSSMVGLVGVLAAFVLSCPTRGRSERDSTGAGINESASGESAAGNVAQIVTETPVWLVVLVAVLAVGVAVVAASTRGRIGAVVGAVRASPGDDDEEGTTDEETVAAVGRVAGRAADRIETGVDVENEVYRAWRSMTDHLDVDRPDSATPAEFAAAATDAGFDPADVNELTELFETVRYGGEAATAERERRAVAALRRIESEAAAETGPEAGDSTTDDGDGGVFPWR